MSTHSIEIRCNGASSELLFNGVSQGVGNAGTDPLDTGFNLGMGSGGGYFFKGSIAEVLFYDAIDNTNRAAIRACLQTKYGL